MAMDRNSRGNRVMNVIIAAGVIVLVSGMMTTPWEGPESFVGNWFKQGMPYLVIGLAALAIGAPRYIRGGKR